MYFSDKRKTRKNVGPLWKETEDLLTQDTEQTEVLKDFFASVFTASAPATVPNCRQQRQIMGE